MDNIDFTHILQMIGLGASGGGGLWGLWRMFIKKQIAKSDNEMKTADFLATQYQNAIHETVERNKAEIERLQAEIAALKAEIRKLNEDMDFMREEHKEEQAQLTAQLLASKEEQIEVRSALSQATIIIEHYKMEIGTKKNN
jgi:hypothetical protein